jgi:hypothetical protein
MKVNTKLQKEYTREQQVAARIASDIYSQDPFWQEVVEHLDRKEKSRQGLVQARPRARK